MAAAAFAEEGDYNSALEMLRKDEKLQESKAKRKKAGSRYSFKKIKQNAAAFVKKQEKLAEAIAFAEAGEHEYARELAAEAFQKRRQILVVGEVDGFTEPVVNYATVLAERLSYDVIGLSVLNLPNKVHKGKVDAVCYAEVIKNGDMFKNKLALLNIGFKHIIKSGDLHKVIKATYHEVARIAYVLLPPEAMAQDRGILNNIPVFCVSPSTQS